MMKVILVDDEPIAIDILTMMLSNDDEINIVGTYTDPLEALKVVGKVKPDLVFLDIEMGEINGLEAAEYFIKELETVEIVFVTAYTQYALEAFEINAIDYLLKPVQEKRLDKTLKRVKEKIKINHEAEPLYLKIKSFKSFEVTDSKGNIITWRTQKSKELFVYLWYNEKNTVSKNSILTNIFPDKDIEKATTLLHTTVYQLRKVLEKKGYANSIIYTNNAYKFNLPIISDIDQFSKISNIQNHNDGDIEELLRIYKGEFLSKEGYFWALGAQQYYTEKTCNILKKYVNRILNSGFITPILEKCIDTLYQIDFYNEETIQIMMKYYWVQNNKQKIEKLFSHYTNKIQREMGLEPDEATLDLYKNYIGKFKNGDMR